MQRQGTRRSRATPTLICGALVFALGLGVVPNIASAEYWPPRPVFDYDQTGDPSRTDCTRPDDPAAQRGRCGALDGPVFNSFVNTPSVGDERAFFDGRRTALGPSSNENVIQSVTEDNGDLTLRLYVNNGANEFFGSKTTAQGTMARIALPKNAGNALRAVGYVSALNASPREVEDTVDFVADGDFKIEYVPGSARLLRDNTSTPLSDSIVTRGTYLQTTGNEGEFEAGFDKAALIEVRVRAVEQNDWLRWLIWGLVAALLLTLVTWIASRRQQSQAAVTNSWTWITTQPLGIQFAGNVLSVAFVAAISLIITTLLK